MVTVNDTRHDTRVALCIGLLIGILSFLWFFGIDRALGTDPAYRWPAGDQAQHIAGAYAYLDGAWSFPLFNTDRINAPQGVNIIFTDSAPFAGLAAKIIHSLTGLRFNYLGTWFAILWVGQAAAGAYLMRQLGPRHPVFYACGAVFALAWPAFLNRHFHLALGSHFLLLFALGLYFATAHENFSWRRTIIWALLLGVAIWTHFYLFLMSFAVFVAAHGDAVIRRTMNWRQAMAAVTGILAWCLGLALVGGYQTVGSINAMGYGAFRMDLLAYVWPHGSQILQAPVIFDPQSAFEGFNYIGLGGIAIVVAALVLLRKRHFAALGGHPLLVLCTLGMLAFAITNVISIGGKQVAYIPFATDRFPFSTFRASGRFGWPFGYLVVFTGMTVLLGLLWDRARKVALLTAILLAGLQFADGMLLLHGMQEGWRATAKPVAETAIQSSASVHFAPPIDCLPSGPVQTAAIEVLAIAARAGKPTDSAHIARTENSGCDAQPQPAAAGSVVVVSPQTEAAAFYGASMSCQEESGLLLCSAAP